MRRWTWMAAIAMLSTALEPPPVTAQTSESVGVVTTLDGRATVARPALPSPLALKFKDDVFVRDLISTDEKSLVRVLLGGKAILTVRELSQVTIREEPGRAVVTLPDGKVVLAVAKQRMRPGESIEIRTPNAVAAVRGSLLSVDHNRLLGITQALCGQGDCTYKHDAQPTTAQLPVGMIAVNSAPFAMASQAQLNAAFNFRPAAPVFSSPDTRFMAAVMAGQTSQAVALAQTVTASPTLLNPTTTQAVQQAAPPLGAIPAPAAPAPVIPFSNAPITPSDIPGAPSTQSTSSSGGTPPPPSGLTMGPNLIVNGGFESGLQGWTLNGSGGTIAALGSILPPEGQAMGLIFSSPAVQQGGGLGPTLSPPLPPYTDSSKVTQSFTVTGNTVYVVKTTYNFFSNEFPSQSTTFDDRLEISVTDPAGTTKLFTLERRNASFTSSTVSPQTASAGGFTIFQGNGVTGFKSTAQNWIPATSGQATYTAQVGDVGDFAVQSAALLDSVQVFADPPLYFVGAGDTLTSTQAGPLAQFTNQPQAFDSLIAVCCGGRASLAGPLLLATNSDLTVPFSLVTLIQGGSLISSTSDPLVSLYGGTHSFGSIGLPIFDIGGVNTGTDAQTGLTLGTDRPLQTAGSLLETSGAGVNAYQAVRVDKALLEATAPLIALMNRSTLTTAVDAIDLSYQAKVTSLGSLVRLDRSSLVVANGAALNVGGGSVLQVTGDLFSLSNGSSLRVLNGPLVSLSGGSILSVNGALIGFGGSGGNLVSVTNSFCPCTTIGGIPVSLTGGALASNVSITGAIKNADLGTVSLSQNAALIRVDGAGTKVNISGK